MSRIIRPKEVRHLLGDIGNTTLYQWVKEGKLPPPVKVLEGSRASGWPEDVIQKLINRRRAYVRTDPSKRDGAK